VPPVLVSVSQKWTAKSRGVFARTVRVHGSPARLWFLSNTLPELLLIGWLDDSEPTPESGSRPTSPPNGASAAPVRAGRRSRPVLQPAQVALVALVAADYLDLGGADSAERKTDARTVDGHRLARMSATSAATPSRRSSSTLNHNCAVDDEFAPSYA
jgi:hypothetical protein